MDEMIDLPKVFIALLAVRLVVLALLAAVMLSMRQRTRRTLDQIKHFETRMRAQRERPQTLSPTEVWRRSAHDLRYATGLNKRRNIDDREQA